MTWSDQAENLGVGIKWVSSACLSCPPCLDGVDRCCLNLKISGYYTLGTFQQYTLAPANYVTPPESVPSPTAAPLLCRGLTALAALTKTNTQPGNWLVVAGAGGGVGHLVCQITARGSGLRVLGIDSSRKEAMARQCGAEEFLSISDFLPDEEKGQQLVETVRELTCGLGAAAAVVCIGENSAYNRCLESLRYNGTLVVVGVQEGKETPIASASPNTFLFHQRRIVGSSVGNRSDAMGVMALAARGVVTPYFDKRTMKDLSQVFRDMEKGELLGKVVAEIP